jgi:predicted amidohydrolase YtcJ
VKAASGDAMIRSGCLKFYAEDEGDDIPRLESDIAGADKAGLQVAIHAIGARPNEIVLGAFEKAIKANGVRDRRFRVEHAQNVRTQDLPRFASSNIIASLQPWLFYSDSGLTSDSYKKLFDLKVSVAFGSDAPMTDFNPLLGIHTAVTGKYGISVEQAVHAYTVGSAYAEFQENFKGKVTPGNFADLIILSDNIFTIEPGSIRTVKVLTTIVGGHVVYDSR